MDSRPSPAVRSFREKNSSALAGRYLYREARWVELTHAKTFPGYPACYVIQENGITVYVGHTTSLRARMHGHRAGILRQLSNPRILVHFGVRYGDWAMREVRLIRRLKPKFNTHGCSHD